jgi:ParB family chromosome partitioning protein
LPESVFDDINTGNISMGHARALSKLKDVNRIKAIASLIVENRLNVREIEALVRKEKKKREIKRQEVTPDFQKKLTEVRDELGKKLPLNKRPSLNQNKLVITFTDESEIEKFQDFIKDKH